MVAQIAALTAIAGAFLSLVLEYVPKLSDWYDARTEKSKRQIMGLLLIISAGGAYLMSCFSPYIVTACTEAGAWELLGSLVMALLAGATANQATHSLTKKAK